MYNLLNIKEVATKKNVTIKTLVELVGVSEPGFYKSIENNSMNIKTVAKIAEILRVSISELLGEKIDCGLSEENVVKSSVENIETANELNQCYKKMYEQQLEITNLVRELEHLKNVYAPVNGAKAG